jgi:hypothetical protein
MISAYGLGASGAAPEPDLMPSPVPDRPGLLVRDPYRYAESVLVVPTPLVPCLAFFNGQCDEATCVGPSSASPATRAWAR